MSLLPPPTQGPHTAYTNGSTSQDEMVVGPRDDPEDTQTTLSLLEVRLRRLEFLLSGSADLDGYPSAIRTPAAGTANVLARLSRLEKDLNKVSRSDSIAGEIISDIEAICTNRYETKCTLLIMM